MSSATASSRNALALAAALALCLPAAGASQTPPRRPATSGAPRATAPTTSPRIPSAPTAPLTFEGLLARFATLPGLSARFREEKRVALLAAPLVSEGTIEFAPPSRLLRRVLTPSPSALLLDGDRLTLADDHASRQIDLRAAPVVRQFVDGFLALIAGDRASLARSYEVQFHPRPGDAWDVELTPKTPAVQRVFRDIRVRGRGVVVEWMSLRETNGDETVTTFSNVDPARSYSPEEAARRFRVTPP